PELKNRTYVFRNRKDAGEKLAGMLSDFRGSDAMVLGIPAGGVPVAVHIATKLELPFDVIPVSKILFPWTTESGFGAVAFDGTEWINTDVVASGQLNTESIQSAIKSAREKVQRRAQHFRGDNPFPELKNRTVILVDDGIAAGSTMRVAILALQKQQAKKIIIAVPTGHAEALNRLADLVDGIYCANLRGGLSFAVADAYEHWTDVSEKEVMESIQGLH
ncbi:MAG: phosphoribosyltransferase, partial [Gammaproteobacteria bacterium]|nr:phosphoribosyltransferase [Gammaproteobacteria bacterium]NIQ11919.1 phosphoribosyltransferase [Gammaproteobacteria bacterium]NIQ74491.1 phosphoribosyltransferase [Gammaproteobacteria bacterium]NIR26490.1 phosphoribosyltransferase [Gammaproteobacteria bacterium]NIR95659.1 phosphoribosyltransferase [Gammaproteobacteria bacterium]